MTTGRDGQVCCNTPDKPSRLSAESKLQQIYTLQFPLLLTPFIDTIKNQWYFYDFSITRDSSKVQVAHDFDLELS